MSTVFDRSDEVIVVPVKSIRDASWGETVELYARVINLTMRDLRIVAATWSMWQRIKPVTPGDAAVAVHSFPYTEIPRMFVSPPHLLATLELNPDHFDVGVVRVITFSYQMSYETTPQTNAGCERATWHLMMPKRS